MKFKIKKLKGTEDLLERLKICKSLDTDPAVLRILGLFDTHQQVTEEVFFNPNTTEDTKIEIIQKIGSEFVVDRFRFNQLYVHDDITLQDAFICLNNKPHPRILELFVNKFEDQDLLKKIYNFDYCSEKLKIIIQEKVDNDFLNKEEPVNIKLLTGKENFKTKLEYANNSENLDLIHEIIDTKDEILLENIFYNNPYINDEIKIKIVKIIGNEFLINKNLYNIRYLTEDEDLATRIKYAKDKTTHPRVLELFIKHEQEIPVLEEAYFNKNITVDQKEKIIKKIGNNFLKEREKYDIFCLTGHESFETRLNISQNNKTHPKVLHEISENDIDFNILGNVYYNKNTLQETKLLINKKISKSKLEKKFLSNFTKIRNITKEKPIVKNSGLEIVITSQPRFYKEAFTYNKDFFNLLSQHYDVKYYIQSWDIITDPSKDLLQNYNKSFLEKLKIYPSQNIFLEKQDNKLENTYKEIVAINNTKNNLYHNILKCKSWKMLFDNTPDSFLLFCKFFGYLISNEILVDKLKFKDTLIFKTRHDLIFNKNVIKKLRNNLDFISNEYHNVYVSNPHFYKSELILDDRYYFMHCNTFTYMFENILEKIKVFCTEHILFWLPSHVSSHPMHSMFYFFLKFLKCNILVSNIEYGDAIIIRKQFKNKLKNNNWEDLYNFYIDCQNNLKGTL